MWQTKLGRCIYRGTDGLEVWQNSRYRWLTLGSAAIQTLIHRKRPQKAMLEYLPAITLALRCYPADFLLCGLGGAGLLHYLRPLLPETQGEVVEVSQAVIDTAEQYFALRDSLPVSLHCQSAEVFLRQTDRQFSHLLIDIHGAEALPAFCLDRQFYLDCHQRLTEDGHLAMNIANGKEQLEVLMRIRSVFGGQTLTIPMRRSANIVVLAARKSIKPLLTALQDSRQVKTLVWNKDWGRVLG